MSFRKWLQPRLAQDRRYLTRFAAGATLFFGGAGLMLFAEHQISPSIGQELVALAGLLICAGGALTAASGYIMLLLIRIFRNPADHD